MYIRVSTIRSVRFILMLIGSLMLPAGISTAQDRPALTVTSIDGEEIILADLLKKGPVLVNFWALWCEPCVIELQQLQSLYERYKDRGFTIIAVNQDNQKSTAKVSSYIASRGYTFTVIADPEGEIAQQFNVHSIPVSVLFDTRGTVAYKALGYKSGDEKKIEHALQQVLMTNEQN